MQINEKTHDRSHYDKMEIITNIEFTCKKYKKQKRNVGVRGRWNKRTANTQTIDFNPKYQ